MTRTATILIATAAAAALAATVALTPRAVGGTILMIALTAVATIWVWRKAGDAPATRRMVIPLYGGLCALIVLGTGVVVYVVERGDYSSCVDKVARSESNFNTWSALFDVVDNVTHTTHYTADQIIPGKPSLRAGLQPPLTVASCAKYKP